MKNVCEVASHGRGALGPVLRETAKAVYQDRICAVCGRPQGTARTVKEKS